MNLFYRVKQSLLATGDLLAFFIGLWVALSTRHLTLAELDVFTTHAPVFVVLFIIWIVINYISGLYDLGKVVNSFTFYRRFLETGLFSLLVGVVFFYAISATAITPKTILVLATLFGYTFSFIWRLAHIRFIGRSNSLQTRILFIGFTKEIHELITLLNSNPEKGFKCAAIIDPDEQASKKDLKNVEIYTTLKTIRPAITEHKIQLVVVAQHLRQDPATMRELYELLFWDAQLTDLTSFYQTITGRIPPSSFSEGWFLDHLKNKEQGAYNAVRTVLDYFASIFLFIIFTVLFPIVAVSIKLTSKGPVFIKQKRVGKGETQFMLYKFRSMYSLSPDGSAEVDGVQFAKKNDKRITHVGKFLRRTRLDELPQAINLIKGDVTLIGPRPERPEIVEQLQLKMPYYSLRHMIKPGLTGWAAVHQHYTDTLETSLQKLQYDLYYINNRSILIDISILLRTVNVVLRMMGQ
jgi:exopolysaccharide biosynthesis polyprenyl glycosylphosphotransferase